jgi:transposase
MAGKTKIMSEVKQILRQHYQGRSKKSIARDLGLSKNTVRRYLDLAQGSGLPLGQLLSKDDQELELLLQRKTKVDRKHLLDLIELFPNCQKELEKTGVTLYLLWGEYRQQHLDGYSYSQFCYHFQQWRQTQKASMIIEHEPGDKVYVDFAGKKLQYYDNKLQKHIDTEVFVGILGCSQLSFAIAVGSQQSGDFIHACRKMLEYFGGSTKAIVTDNLKSSVTKANKYEPDISISFSDFCNHYNMACIPTRPAKPKDKSLVENLVGILYNRVYARLRHRTFYSLTELNTAISDSIDEHNSTLFSRRNYSRVDLFESKEKSLLQRLPDQAFEQKHYRIATVQKNSHVLLGEDKNYYSVPMRYIGKKVNIIYTATDVNIFFENQRIAYHQRTRVQSRYTTIAEHLPSTHQYMMGLNAEHFIRWARDVNQHVEIYVARLIELKKHPEQAFKSCQGIQSLMRRLGKQKLVDACKTGIELKVYSYSFLKNAMQAQQQSIDIPDYRLPYHENIRGADAYK